MRIINLIENTEGINGCAFEHGLSFYVEIGPHKLLMDLGLSENVLKNAEVLGIGLDEVDTVILSHGHYDHSGGIMPFSEINDHALIYMQRTACEEHYADERKAAERKEAERKATERKAAERKAAERKAAERKAAERKAAERKAAERKATERKTHNAEGGKALGGKVYDGELHQADISESPDGSQYRYNGIDRQIPGLPQVRLLDGDLKIDDNLEIMTVQKKTHEIPFTNKRLMVKRDGLYIRDDFRHEQCLVLKEGAVRILMSGCAHNGILNIMDSYIDKYDSPPDVVISGFHLMANRDYRENELDDIVRTAEELKQYKTLYYTCHCTGIPAFDVMKEILGDQLMYVHSGEEIPVGHFA